MKTCSGKSCEKRKAVVIGGGLVGALSVCLLAERGYEVTMYEKRDGLMDHATYINWKNQNIRKIKTTRGRSINLALSHRGRKALRLIGIETEVLKNSIPMTGRLLHNQNGLTASVPYDPLANQCIHSVGRNFLNRTLLNVAEKHLNVKLIFNHKLVDVEMKENTITLKNLDTNATIKVTADLIIGADGAFSVVRSFLQKTSLFDFSQSFIDHGYLELSVPSERGNQLHSNHLHIWPRGEFMMIALPNQDCSWTVTLFMPFQKFQTIDNVDKLVQFFKTTFPDALPLIGEKELEETYFENSPAPLVSIKCGRYDMGDKFLIIGDAAHAMVPFYGQGMNAGFEDCSLLNEILNQTQDNIPETIKTFTAKRREDAHAICDLAMYNYTEMRDLVTKPTFRLRKIVDKHLGKILPDIWIPLYNSVSFSHMRYSQCMDNKRWQDKMLLGGSILVAGITLILFSLILVSIL